MGASVIAAPIEYMEGMKIMKKGKRSLKERIRDWRHGVDVWWWQEGNTVYVRAKRMGFFKSHSGIACGQDIKIDPALIDSSSPFTSTGQEVKASEVAFW